MLITLQYPLVSALTPLLLARSLSTRSTLQLHPRALPAATLAAVSSPRRRTAPIICAPCTLPLPLARDSYHVALALPFPSRVLAAHHTSKPVTPALVCLRSARADFRSATHQDLNPSLYLRRLLDLLDSSCRPVLSASLLQHHHIGATHYSPLSRPPIILRGNTTHPPLHLDYLRPIAESSWPTVLICLLDSSDLLTRPRDTRRSYLTQPTTTQYGFLKQAVCIASFRITRGDRWVRTRAFPAPARASDSDVESSPLTRTRPQLPPMGYLDHDKARRDEDVYQDRLTGAPQALPLPPAASPAHQYPSGPPPPYSHPAPPSQYMSNITSSTPANTHTPPESRRTSENEKEAIKQTVRHSLPSISEALGVETKPIYRPTLPVQTTPSSTHAPPPTHGLASSPSPRSHRMEPPQQSSEQHTAPTSHFAQYRQDAQRHPSYPSADAPRPSYADSRPPVHMPAARSPPPQRSAHHPSQYAPTPTPRSPAHEQPPQHPSGAMGPPSFPYGYQPYPSRYAAAAPPPPAPAAGPIYQPSLSNAAPSSAPKPWKAENARYGGEERTYGDSVKRQLEMYDLAGALSDVRKPSTEDVMMHKLTPHRFPPPVEL